MNTNDRTASLNGIIVRIEDACATVETSDGKAPLNIDDTLDYRLKVGDVIEVEDAGWYIQNGRIVTILGYQYRLNGNLHIIKEE